MEVFRLESKAFQENFTNLPNGSGSYLAVASADCENFDPHKGSLDSMYASNYPANGEVSPPMKAHNENTADGETNYCRIKDGDMSPTGRKYSNRRATTERRNRINERERDRMHQLCDAFEKLRTVLPYKRSKRGPNRQKLSKIATLLLAQNYIRTLEDMLRRPTEYTNTNAAASAVAAANMVSQALAAAGVPTVNDAYTSYADGAISATSGGSGGMLEPNFTIHGVTQDVDSSQFYYMQDYHDYGMGGRVLSAEHAYPYL